MLVSAVGFPYKTIIKHQFPNQLLFGCFCGLQFYAQARLKARWARLFRPTLQFFLVATAVYVGLSRVSDYKHHWSDVLMGLLLGGSVGIFTVSLCLVDVKLLKYTIKKFKSCRGNYSVFTKSRLELRLTVVIF